MDKRGLLQKQTYLTPTRLEMIFHMPLAEIVLDFYDQLKSSTRGYASFDYHLLDYRETDLVRLDIKLNGEQVDALSALVHRSKAEYMGRRM
jgi:GTP-binding protein LepA